MDYYDWNDEFLEKKVGIVTYSTYEVALAKKIMEIITKMYAQLKIQRGFSPQTGLMPPMPSSTHLTTS